MLLFPHPLVNKCHLITLIFCESWYPVRNCFQNCLDCSGHLDLSFQFQNQSVKFHNNLLRISLLYWCWWLCVDINIYDFKSFHPQICYIYLNILCTSITFNEFSIKVLHTSQQGWGDDLWLWFTFFWWLVIEYIFICLLAIHMFSSSSSFFLMQLYGGIFPLKEKSFDTAELSRNVIYWEMQWRMRKGWVT